MRRATSGAFASGAVLVAAALVTACETSAGTARASLAPIEEPCQNVSVEGARCFRLSVPEDRSAYPAASPAARRISRHLSLRIVVLRATGPIRAPDGVLYLPGGPGQAASELISAVLPELEAVRLHRDLIFADQRGTGGSNSLECRFYGPPTSPASYFGPFLPIDEVKACRDRLVRTADLADYTTAASVEDLEAIRRALEYPHWTLIGGSYGTRLAMEYVRAYESHVRAVVLDSPVTPGSYSPERFGQFAAQALDGVIDECEKSHDCARAFPRVRDEARQVFARLERAPVTATTAHPVGRIPGEVTLTRDHVAEAVRYLLYSSAGASRVPLYLHLAATGDYAPLADFLIRWRSDGTFDGLYLSITCTEDVPFIAADAASFDEKTFLGSYRVRQQREACSAWPRGVQPPGNRTPVTTAVPVLLTSGGLDPVTPPANADELLRTLSRGLHIRVPPAGHSPAGLAGLECLTAIKADFIERGRADGLDTSCVANITRPGFLTAR